MFYRLASRCREFLPYCLIDFAGDSDTGLSERVRDLCLTQARGVVLESEMLVLFIDAEAAQAVGVGEFTEAAELFKAQRRLQLVRDFEQCHGSDYNSIE